MSETTNEYMDTGALTEDAVPEPAPVTEPGDPVGSPSTQDTDAERGPDADLPHGATIESL